MSAVDYLALGDEPTATSSPSGPVKGLIHFVRRIVTGQGRATDLINTAAPETAALTGSTITDQADQQALIPYPTTATTDSYGRPISYGPQPDDDVEVMYGHGPALILGQRLSYGQGAPPPSSVEDIRVGPGLTVTDYGQYDLTDDQGRVWTAPGAKDPYRRIPLISLTGQARAAAYDVRPFGAELGTEIDNIAAINTALLAAQTDGVAEVFIPPGVFKVAPNGDPYVGQGGNCIRLVDGVTLHLLAGSVLQVIDDSGPYGSLIYAYGVSDARVVGPGTIDLNSVGNPFLPGATEGHEGHAIRFQNGGAHVAVDNISVDNAGGRQTIIFNKAKSTHDSGISHAITAAYFGNFDIHWVDPTLETFTAALGTGTGLVATLTRGSVPDWITAGITVVVEGGGGLAEQATVDSTTDTAVIFSSAIVNTGHTLMRKYFDNTAAYFYAQGLMENGYIHADDDTSMAGPQTSWEAQGPNYQVHHIRSKNFAYGFDHTTDNTGGNCQITDISMEGLASQAFALYPTYAMSDVLIRGIRASFTQANHGAWVTNGIGMLSSSGVTGPASRIRIDDVLLSFQDEGNAGRLQGVTAGGEVANCTGRAIDFESFGTLNDISLGTIIVEKAPYIGMALSGFHAEINKLTVENVRFVDACQNLDVIGTPYAVAIDGTLTDVELRHVGIYDDYGTRRTRGLDIAPGGTYTRCVIRHYRKNASDGSTIPDFLTASFPVEDTNNARTWPTSIQQTDAAGNKVWGIDTYGRSSTKRGTAIPSVTANANVGSTGQVILEGDSTDTAGKITILPSGTGIASGVQFTFNFGAAMPTTQYAVTISQAQDDDGSGFFLSGVSSNYGPGLRTTTTWEFIVNAVLTTGNKYVIHYRISKYGS